MAIRDITDRVFREFHRYTGDGRPNEPTGALLPIGDPQSGVHSPKKADLREAFGDAGDLVDQGVDAAATAAGEAQAAQLAAESAAGANLSNANTRAAAIVTNIPAPVVYIRTAGYATAGDGGEGLYQRAASEPSHEGKFQSADGAWWELVSVRPNERMFGAVGANAAVDTPAIQALFDYCAAKDKTAHLVGRNYFINATLALGSGMLHAGRQTMATTSASYHFIKVFDGDLMTVGNAGEVHGLIVNGRGASQTGRGIVVSGNGDQMFVNNRLIDFSDVCLDYEGASNGLRSSVIGGWYLRTDSTAVSIRWPSEASNGNRTLIGVYANLINVTGSDNGAILGCNITGINFSGTAKKVRVVGNRIANAVGVGLPMTVFGVDHTFAGNVFSGDVSVQSTTTMFDESNRVAGSLTVVPHATNRVSHGPIVYTPTWNALTTNPSIGNGTIEGEYELDGPYIIVRGRLQFGSTTTFGSGVWIVSLPLAPKTTNRAILGGSFAFDAGTSFLTGQSIILPGETSVRFLMGPAPGNYTSSGSPITWATGDRLEFEIRYRIN